MNHLLKRAKFSRQDMLIMLALAVVVLVGFIVSPVAAQDPPEGDVNAAAAVRSHQYAKQKFSLRPYSEWTINSPIGFSQLVPENSRATTELMVNRIGDVSSVAIAFDYRGGVATVADVYPGSIFDGLTEGVDYIIQKELNRASPRNSVDEPALPTFWPYNYMNALSTAGLYTQTVTQTIAAQPDRRSYINISIINPNKQILFQNGSVIRIDWQVAANNPGAKSYVVFTQIDPKDVSGNSIAPCFGVQEPAFTDDDLPPFGNSCVKLRNAELANDFTTTLPDGSPNPTPPVYFQDTNADGVPDITDAAGNYVYQDEPIVGVLEITNRPVGLTFQVALQGLVGDSDKYDDVDVTVNQFGTPFVANPDMTGRVLIPVNPPYEVLTVERAGYLDAIGNNINDVNLFQVELTAGDVNNDNVVNIFDLTLMANALNTSSSGNATLEIMDYNDDGLINIADLALVAGNFRTFGPTPIP